MDRQVGHIDEPLQNPRELVLCVRAMRIGLPVVNHPKSLLSLLRSGRAAVGGVGGKGRKE